MEIKENALNRIKEEVTKRSGERYRFDCYQYEPRLDYYSDRYDPLDEDDNYGGHAGFTLTSSYTWTGFRHSILCGGYRTQFLPDIQSVVRRWDFLEYQTLEVEPRILSYIKFIREYKTLHTNDVLFLILVPYDEEKNKYDSECKKAAKFLELSKVRGLQTTLSGIPGLQETLNKELEYFDTLVDTNAVRFIFYPSTSTAAGIRASIFTDIYSQPLRSYVIVTSDITRLGFDFDKPHVDSDFNDSVSLDLGLIEYTARGIQVVECTKSAEEPDYPYQVYFANLKPNWHLPYVVIPESTLCNDTTLHDARLYSSTLHHTTMIGELDTEKYCDCTYIECGGDVSTLYNSCQTIYYYLQEMLFRHNISYARSDFGVVYIPFEDKERAVDLEFSGYHTETLILHGATPENILSKLKRLNLFHLPSTKQLEMRDLMDSQDWIYLAGSKDPFSNIDKHVPYEQYVFLDGNLFQKRMEIADLEELLNKLKMPEGQNFRLHIVYLEPRFR